MTAFFFCFFSINIIFAPIEAAQGDSSGHIKYQGLLDELDNDSDFNHAGDIRLKLSTRKSNWSLQVDYQLLSQHSDAALLPDDDQRLFDLTSSIHSGKQSEVAHRLDRLHLGYTGEQTVVRFGRQAVTWGNGLTYTPLDFFNPFDPAAIDREYKTGDDMLYGQYSFESGNDLQLVWVGRRDADGERSGEVASLAAKYHIFFDFFEIDLLLAEHFDENIIAVGGLTDIGGSVWRGDIVSTDTTDSESLSAVLNASWSWIAWDRNMSGFVEIYRNGFGIDDGDYSPGSLTRNPALLERIERGELFTLGKHYLSASATVELTPLWLLTTTLFSNLDDDSNMLQVVSHHDLLQDLQLLVALNLPSGSEATEFGRVEESLIAQLAWYF